MRLLFFVTFPAVLLLWVWKTSPSGEIWMEIHTTHILSSAGTKTAHEWVSFDCLIDNCEIVLFYSFPHDSPHITLVWPKKWFRLKTQTIQYQNWAKMPIFSQELMGSPFQNIFKPEFSKLHSDWIPHTMRHLEFKIRLVQSRQQHSKLSQCQVNDLYRQRLA